MFGVRLLFVAALAAAAAIAPARGETRLPTVGGTGGGPFEARCPGGIMRGAELRTGDDVNAIRPICAQVTANGAISGEGPVGPWRGSDGGAFQRVICPLDRPAVVAMTVESEGRATEIVNMVGLSCGRAGGDASTAALDAQWRGPPVGKPNFGTSFGAYQRPTTYRCPANETAVGVYGRHGIWLDNVGLVCAAYTPVAASSTGIANRRLGKVGGPSVPGPPKTPIQICQLAKKAQARPTLPANTKAVLIQKCLTGYPGSAANSANACVQAKLRNAAGRPFAAELARCFASLPAD